MIGKIKRTMVVFSQPNDLETKRYLEILERVTEMFGTLGLLLAICITMIPKEESELLTCGSQKGLLCI